MKRVITSASEVENAGMILELFGDAVSEVKLPEGYVWDYKIDSLSNGDTAGQCFIMTEDDQPVAFFTFSLMVDGKPLEIYRDKKDAELCDQLSRKLQKAVDSLGDLETHVGKPSSRTLELTGKVEGSTMKKKFIVTASRNDSIAPDFVKIVRIADDLSELLDEVSRMSDVNDYLDEYDLDHISSAADALYDFAHALSYE